MTEISSFKSGRQLLSVFTGDKHLPEFIPKLPPNSLGHLIQEIGIADSGELIEFSTPDQFVAIVDDSVWASNEPGMPERFVPEQFLAWMDLVLGIGDEFAAERFAAMDEDLLATAVAYFVKVQDLNLRVVDASDIKQEGQVDALAGLDHESSTLFDQFEVTPIFVDEWDVIEPALAALRAYEPKLFAALLSRCCMGGSILVSNRDHKTELDAAHNREMRQEAQGFVTPGRAKIFLEAARDSDLRSILKVESYDLDTVDYFSRVRRNQTPEKAQEPIDPQFHRLHTTIAQLEDRHLAQKFLGYDGPTQRLKLEIALSSLDTDANSRCMNELAYLSNLLVQGEQCDGSRINVDDSARIVMATCNLGHELFPASDIDVEPGLVRLFRIGWNVIQKLQGETLKALRHALRPEALQNLDLAKLWVLQEVARDLNQPSLDADLVLRRFDSLQDCFDLLELVFGAEVVKGLKLLASHIPRSMDEQGRVSFISCQDDLRAISRFLDLEVT